MDSKRTRITKSDDPKLQELRELCYDSLWIYAQTVEPHRVYAQCHKEAYEFFQKCIMEGDNHALLLYPRDHQKSHLIAVTCTWLLYRDPAETIGYISATESLSILQLYDIKQIFESSEFKRLCPDMIHAQEKKREKWAETAIIVDHPIRHEERPRDPSVFAAGLDSNSIGAHCTTLIKDDVVVDKNSLTEGGRAKVRSKAGHLSSILTTGGKELCVGTRYHPKDHWQDLIDMKVDIWDLENDEIIGSKNVFRVMQRAVETDGVFLYPRIRRESDGAMYGFDRQELALKKAKYTEDIRNFYCQYYNEPNAISESGIESDHFLYYDREKVIYRNGKYWLGKSPLTIIAAQDFAYSVRTGSDSTCLIVLGMDYDSNIYVLDIYRYKTTKPSVYWDVLDKAQNKWKFKWVRAEATAAQIVIIESLRDYIAEDMSPIRIKTYKPTSHDGKKEERISQTLEPLYDTGKIHHYRGGECVELEAELVADRPPHDDIKDALHIGVGFDKLKPPPKEVILEQESYILDGAYTVSNSRFGGYA